MLVFNACAFIGKVANEFAEADAAIIAQPLQIFLSDIFSYAGVFCLVHLSIVILLVAIITIIHSGMMGNDNEQGDVSMMWL